MSIPETQLDTWSKQGSVTQSKETYQTVRNVLESNDAPYNGKEYTIFLQGSYGNDTNIYADSDVDIVIRLGSTFYYDLSELAEPQKEAFQQAYSSAPYGYEEFKKDVFEHLKAKFGQAVKMGGKAIFIPGSGDRRDCDVLPATLYRRYLSFSNIGSQNYIEGISFFASDGTRIINYPKQHAENCTRKHQQTNNWFKPSVRVLKNMRNKMITDGVIGADLAPSYFLEGMLYNVPNNSFGQSYNSTIAASLNWLKSTDDSKLVCANEQYYLLNPASPVTWRQEKFVAFLDAATKYWNNW